MVTCTEAMELQKHRKRGKKQQEGSRDTSGGSFPLSLLTLTVTLSKRKAETHGGGGHFPLSLPTFTVTLWMELGTWLWSSSGYQTPCQVLGDGELRSCEERGRSELNRSFLQSSTCLAQPRLQEWTELSDGDTAAP